MLIIKDKAGVLAYARRLREAGFSELQAEGQAQALAAAMTDTLATKQDLREMETRIDARFAQVDARFAHLDTRLEFSRSTSTPGLPSKRSELRFASPSRRYASTS